MDANHVDIVFKRDLIVPRDRNFKRRITVSEVTSIDDDNITATDFEQWSNDDLEAYKTSVFLLYQASKAVYYRTVQLLRLRNMIICKSCECDLDIGDAYWPFYVTDEDERCESAICHDCYTTEHASEPYHSGYLRHGIYFLVDYHCPKILGNECATFRLDFEERPTGMQVYDAAYQVLCDNVTLPDRYRITMSLKGVPIRKNSRLWACPSDVDGFQGKLVVQVM